MLEGVSDSAELIKRHRDSLERLSVSLTKLLALLFRGTYWTPLEYWTFIGHV